MEKIKKSMLIGDIIKEHPEVAELMMSRGLHCIGCHVSPFESIEAGCKSHGMKEDDINEMVKDMNELISRKKKKE
jgi:hybrid cluster-associated redox disulfide protein